MSMRTIKQIYIREKVINLKVFWLNKSNNKKETPLFRSAPLHATYTKFEFSISSPFNFINFHNPSTNKCIYTIHDLHFKSKDDNIVRLYMGDTLRNIASTETTQSLQVEHKIKDRLCANLIELYETNHKRNELIEFTSDNYAIILPGGSLAISTEKIINNADISILWSIDEL